MESNATTPLLLLSFDDSSKKLEINDIHPPNEYIDENVEQNPTLSNVSSLLEPDGSSSSSSSPLLLSCPKFSWCRVIILFLNPAIGGFLFGYDISATSFAIVQQETTNQIVFDVVLVQGFIVASSSIGALIGSFLIYYFDIANFVGRRTELRYSALFYIIGAILELCAGFLWPVTLQTDISESHVVGVVHTVMALIILLIGRVIYGLGIAFAMHGGPTYLAEMMPASVRGLFVSLKEASIVLGILGGYVAGYIFSSSALFFDKEDLTGWKFTYTVSLLFSLTMYVLTYYIPESCRFLVLKGRNAEALQSLKFAFPTDDNIVQHEFNNMIMTMTSTPTVDEYTTVEQDLTIWTNPSYRAPLRAGIGLVVLQQITGQPSVLSYATPILRNAGLSDSASIYLAIFKLLATLIAASTVEFYGRRKLLYFGNTLMLLSLITLACYGSFDVDASEDHHDDSNKTITTWVTTIPAYFLQQQQQQGQVLVLIALFTYIGGYQFSFGPISWLIISEVFPLQLRGQAVAYAVQMNFLFNAIVQLLVPLVQRLIGYNVTFGIFAFLTAFSLFFVRAYVPETKGLTLEQIEQTFRSNQ